MLRKSTSFLTFLAFSIVGFAQSPSPLQVDLQFFTNQVDNPVAIVNAGDDRLFVVEQNSADIEIFDLTGTHLGKFLDLSGTVNTSGSEQGLLGLAFHPNYSSNGKFYVNYTAPGAGGGSTHISEFTVSANPNVANAASEVVLLSIGQDFSNHNGGSIVFGPDGYLYIGMGDGGSGGDPNNRAQTPTTLLGKMLRINVPGNGTYTIPGDNPFVGDAGVLDEIWALGVRNPWKFSFDALTGDLWIADVGQNMWEEINLQLAASPGGENYGWRCYEGLSAYNTSMCSGPGSYDQPIQVHSHSGESFCSITGGYVYRGAEFEDMQGRYFYTDYCIGGIRSLHPDGVGGWIAETPNSAGSFGYSTFGEDMNGELYLGDISGDVIFRLVDPCDTFLPTLDWDETDLTVSEGTSFWWYQDDVIIGGVDTMSYVPESDGAYYAVAEDANGCAKATNTIVLGGGIGIPGCTYSQSENYDPEATIDDGSCIWPETNDCPGDFNGDLVINTSDLLDFLSAFGQACP